MKLKKVLTCTGLAFTILISAIPTISASATSANTHSEIIKIAECKKERARLGVFSSRDEIPATKEINGTTWYLKGVESWKGEWYGLYEGWVCG
ncbi:MULTISPECIES: hypothetical protein [Bacillus subtilis group]|uniref:hypothetical protein n=1 Tax=Bacillus subtilis group TaxID=653685 RepID=UPI0011A848C9|nr:MULTISPECIES: hypothetical protein [Bacillus subtilis group]MCJ8221411.1 hypothetical protein [Bacillus paralicheniformis]